LCFVVGGVISAVQYRTIIMKRRAIPGYTNDMCSLLIKTNPDPSFTTHIIKKTARKISAP